MEMEGEPQLPGRLLANPADQIQPVYRTFFGGPDHRDAGDNRLSARRERGQRFRQPVGIHPAAAVHRNVNQAGTANSQRAADLLPRVVCGRWHQHNRRREGVAELAR